MAAAGDAGNAVTVTMTVTSTNTCAGAIATATYTINVDKLPTANATGPHTICQNASYTLQNGEASMTNAKVQSWTENGAGSITGGNTTLTPTYAAAAADAGNAVTLTMTVTSTNTCAGAIATATYTINVDKLPTAASGGNHTICQNASYTLQNGEASMTNATVLSWAENGAGSITNGATTLTPTYKAAAGDAGNAVTLTMTVTSNNTCSGATATASYTINVDPLPTATTTGTHTICENASYTLQNGEAGQSYGSPQWTANGAGSITSGANTLTPTYTAAAGDAGNAVTLTMKVSSTNTCSGATATANYIINVDPLPIATAGTPQTICQGSAATVSNAGYAYGTINWTTNGQGTLTNSGTLSPQYNSTAADAGKTVILTMTVTSTNTCALPIATSTKSAITPITVRPALTATVAAPIVCQNNTAQVIFTITSQGTPPYTFSYTENGATKTVSTIDGNNIAVVGVSTSNPGTVTYSLTNVQDANCQQTVVASATMTVLPLPNASISKNEDVCRDSVPKAILLKGFNSTKPYTFTFTVNNDSVTQSADSIYSTNPATNKTGTFVYTLTNVTDGNNCSKTLNQTATVVVHENPHALFTINPESTSILEPTITITDASIATTSWYWDFGDKNSSPSSDPKEHTYADTGTYKIKLIASNSLCKDSTSEIVRITLPTSLYVPNTFTPNGDGVNDVFKAQGDGITSFEMMIYDRWGQLIFQSTDINKGWDGKVNGGSEIGQIDAYVYVINITAFANKHDYTYRGVVNLLK
jgi:gliding motility-associated-like protein